MCRRQRTRALLLHLTHLVHELDRKADTIMATQADLDALVARIDTATAGIRQDIADIKAANPGIDLSALEDRVAGLEGLDAENPAPPAEPQE